RRHDGEVGRTRQGGDRAARPADRAQGAAASLAGSALERRRQAPGAFRGEHRAAGLRPPRASSPASGPSPATPGAAIAAGGGNAAPAADVDAAATAPTAAVPAATAAVLSGPVPSRA